MAAPPTPQPFRRIDGTWQPAALEHGSHLHVHLAAGPEAERRIPDGWVWRRRYGAALAVTGLVMRLSTRIHAAADDLDVWLAARAWKVPAPPPPAMRPPGPPRAVRTRRG